uniref:Uncharacterized protein n=1 Tax=Acrobeloides nanus TaxID=290746 RepID=A0A914DQT0_9BILA
MIIFVPETLAGFIYPILYPQEKVRSGGNSGWWTSDGKMTLHNLMMTTATPRTPYGNKSPITLRLELFLMAAVMALTDGIAMWFLSVVYRAYRYMKIEIGEPYRGEPYLEFDGMRR